MRRFAELDSADSVGATVGCRCFLFLEGHPSPFARNLADHLEGLGHRVVKITLCTGDALYWRGRPARAYRGRFARWRGFLDAFVAAERVTDILYYGDRRPYHRVAAEVARARGIDCYAYEFGYLRPNWITIERCGMSAYSHFPADPDAIRAIAGRVGAPDPAPQANFTKATELFHEVAYNLASFAMPAPYPFYRADRYYNLVLDYLSGIPGLVMAGARQARARAVVDRLAGQRYFLLPLQLQSDYQLRANAPFAHQRDALDLVLRSFAEHAPADTRLVVKTHPLDNGWERWPAVVARLARALGIGDRVDVICGGNLDTILRSARGCVLINSTVGLHALQFGCPVKVLGTAIFDVPGVCDSGPLNGFWANPRPPDPDLTRCLVRALAATIQVRGNFFTAAGRAAAVPAMAAMLVERRVNGAGAYVDPPPRLARLEAARSRLRVEPVAEPGHEEAHGIGQAAAARVAHFFQGLNELLGFAKAER